MKSKTKGSYFGKYWEIILAAILFLTLDISVLALNFYTSFQIDQDTVAINLSSRQRYVSQRIARTLLELDAARAAGKPYNPATIDELRAGMSVVRSISRCRSRSAVPLNRSRLRYVPDRLPSCCTGNATKQWW